jgi:hypothetical protein
LEKGDYLGNKKIIYENEDEIGTSISLKKLIAIVYP